MKAERIPYCIFGLFLFAACSGGEDYEQQLERFEKMNQTDVPLCVDSVQPLVRHYDHWWHSPNHRMRAYYMLGCAYRDQGSAPRALENYQRAVSIADTTDSHCDLNTLMRIHSQMSQIFFLQRLPEQEEEELRIAERLAWQIGDTLAALIFKEYLCNTLCNKKEYYKCIDKALSLHRDFLIAGYKNNANIPYVFCYRSYMELKDYPNAKKYLDLYEECPHFRDQPEMISGGAGILYIYKGNYFLKTGQADSADYYFHKAIPFTKLGNNELLTYRGLCNVYTTKHNADSLSKYVRLYSEVKERNFDEAQAAAIIQTNKLYDYSIEQNIAKEKAEKVARLSVYLAVAVLFMVFTVIFFIYYRKNKRKRMVELLQKYEVSVQQLKESEEQLSLLKMEETCNQDLLAQYQYDIDEQKSQTLLLKQKIHQMGLRKKGADLKSSEIVRQFENMRAMGKTPSDEEWRKLRKTIETIYPTFRDHMNAREDLLENEYKVCMLVAIECEPSRIDAMMEKSNSFSAMTRKRLCTKVFGVNGKPSDFDRLMHQLYS